MVNSEVKSRFIAADQSLLRMSLVPRIWTNIIENAKYFETFRLFEIGKEIHRGLKALPGRGNRQAKSDDWRDATSREEMVRAESGQNLSSQNIKRFCPENACKQRVGAVRTLPSEQKSLR